MNLLFKVQISQAKNTNVNMSCKFGNLLKLGNLILYILGTNT